MWQQSVSSSSSSNTVCSKNLVPIKVGESSSRYFFLLCIRREKETFNHIRARAPFGCMRADRVGSTHPDRNPYQSRISNLIDLPNACVSDSIAPRIGVHGLCDRSESLVVNILAYTLCHSVFHLASPLDNHYVNSTC